VASPRGVGGSEDATKTAEVRAVIRADGSSSIGRGHLARCRNLVIALADRGVRSTFVRRGPQDGALDRWPIHWISDEGLGSEPSDVSDDAQRTLEAIAMLGGADLVIVDHYELDAVWHSAVGRTGAKIVVIDDLADREYDCDVLINSGPLAPDRYEGRVPSSARLLLGPGYALLDPVSASRRSAIAHQTDVPRPVQRILVTLGGGSAAAGLEVVLPSLADPRLSHIALDVVLGADPHVCRELLAALARDPRRSAPLEVYGWVDDLPEMMARADLAIGAGGVSNWERMLVGLPSVVLAVAENQEAACSALDSEGLIRYVGPLSAVSPEQVADAVAALVADAPARRTMARRGQALVDGAGAIRSAAVIYDVLVGGTAR
jgi:UDP-2,4-diacetamido-2,4,6-trideoxy-beta-L-altropyranose hydrolase